MYHIDELGRYILGFGALKTSAFLILYFIFIFFLTRKLDNSKKEKLLISCAYFSISLLAFIVIVIFGYIGNEIGFETFGFIFGALFCPLILMFLFKAIGFILASLVRLARILKPK